MDCFGFFFFLIIAVAFIADWSNKEKLKRQREEALKNHNTVEYNRLNNIITQNKNTRRNNTNHPTDQDYMDAIMVLEAAEHGVFLPNAEEVFDKVEGPEQNINNSNDEYDSIDNNENNSHEYYDENEEF